MKKRLGDYIQEYSVRNKSGEDIPVYSITNSQGFCRDYFSKEVASKDKTSYKIVPRGCFAYNPSRINVGSVDWQRDEERVIVSPLYNVFSVSPEIDQQYLYYYLKSSATSYRIKEVATGSVRDNLRLSMLYDFMIELPSLDVQRQIVSNLDLLASIIRQRNQQLTKLDELIKARFVEMFGDMLLNSLEWPEKPLEGLADIVSGITKGRKTTETGLIEVPYMAVSNVKSGYIDWTTIKTILATKQEIEQYRLMPDDILMTEGGDPDKVGRGAIIKNPLKDSIHQNHIFRVRLDKSELLPAYFAEYLQHQKAKRYFLGCAKQTTGIASINMRQLRALPVLIPPLPLQNQFADFVAEVDKSKLLAELFAQNACILAENRSK